MCGDVVVVLCVDVSGGDVVSLCPLQSASFLCLLILFLVASLPPSSPKLPEKLDEMLAGGQQEVVLRARPSDDFRAATVKQRPTSRRITQAEINVRKRFRTRF